MTGYNWGCQRCFIGSAAQAASSTVRTPSAPLQLPVSNSLDCRPEIGLLVVDSIAAVFRGEFHLSEMADRSDTLFSFGRKLKALSDRFHIAVVCINQVGSLSLQQCDLRAACAQVSCLHVHPQVSAHITLESSLFATSKLKPALGLSWSTCVNTRLMLRRVTSRHVTVDEVGP